MVEMNDLAQKENIEKNENFNLIQFSVSYMKRTNDINHIHTPFTHSLGGLETNEINERTYTTRTPWQNWRPDKSLVRGVNCNELDFDYTENSVQVQRVLLYNSKQYYYYEPFWFAHLGDTHSKAKK